MSGRGYDWTVTGGQIISGQGLSKIEVSWDQPGLIGTVEYTAFSMTDSQCEGKAASIQVEVANEFIAEVQGITAVGCSSEKQVRLPWISRRYRALQVYLTS